MTPTEFVEALRAHKVATQPPLTAGQVEELGRAIDATVPREVAELYALCGGITDADWDGSIPVMRLMTPEEVIEDHRLHTEEDSLYEASLDARYFWSDDGSNWAGVFVRGEHVGKVCLLDHDDPSSEPRFGSVASFLRAAVDAGLAGLDWHDLESDL